MSDEFTPTTKETTMTIPEFLPVLSAGAHRDPRDGACVMEYVSLLAGEEFSDKPSCTHPVLARAAQTVNDRLPDKDRHLLVPLIGRLFGTADTRESELDRHILHVRLAVWSARRVEHLLDKLSKLDKRAAVAATDAAEAWANEPTEKNAYAAYAAYTNAAYAATYAAYAATNAAYAAYTNATYAATYAAYAATYAAYANDAAAAEVAANSLALVGFLSDLLDYHAELTGHQARDVSDAELRALASQVGL